MLDADCPPFDASERLLEISTASLEARVKVVQMVSLTFEHPFHIEVCEDLASRQEVPRASLH